MRRFFTKKRAGVVLGGGTLAVLGAVAAFAFFTASGSGNGSASVGTSGTWAINAGTSVGTLYPDPASGGTNLVTVPYTVTNQGHGQQNLNNVTYAVANTDGSAWSTSGSAADQGGACTASDFRLGPSTNSTGSAATDAYSTDVAASGTVSGNATIEMIDSSKNQNACQGVTVPLHFTEAP